MTKAELTVIMASVKSYVEGRLAQVEVKAGPPGERGEPGEPGKAAVIDYEDILARVRERSPLPSAETLKGHIKYEIDAAVAALPKPENGKDAVIDLERIVDRVREQIPVNRPEDIQVFIKQEVNTAVAAIPKAENGKDADPVLIKGLIDTEVARAVEALPKPKDGNPGLPGKDAILPDLEPLIQRAFDSGFSRWAVDMERRAQDLFQRAIERMPVPKDGKDGFELEDLSVTDDGHGNVTLTFIRGALTRSFVLRLPCFEYCGTFEDGRRYLSGHGVTYGGSFWIAQKDDAQGKPGDRDTDWILAVKKGRDGRDGVMREPKPEATVKL